MRSTSNPLDSTSKWSNDPLPSRSKISACAGLVLAFLLPACIDDTGRPGTTGVSTASAVEVARGDVSVAGAYLAGRLALEQGNLLEAADNFEIALSAEPDNSELRRQVFLLRLAGGDLDNARTNAAGLLELGIESDEARMLLAFEALKEGRLDEAGERTAEIGTGGISGMVGPLIGSWMSFARGEQEEALRSISGGEGGDGLALVRSYHHASMLALMDRTEEAYTQLSADVDIEERAPTRLLMALVAAQVQTGHADEARAALDAQLALAPDDTILADLSAKLDANGLSELPIDSAEAGMADALLSLARALGDQRGGSQALLLARLASYLAPKDGDVWLLIAQQMLSEGSVDAALVALEQVDRAGYYGWDADLLRARAYNNSERNEEAFSLLREMGERRPERADALVTLGDMLRRDEMYAEAETAYSAALERIGAREPEHWRLFYARGIAFERTKRWPEAEADFLLALDLQPDQPFVLNYLGYSWVDQGLYLDRAKGMLRQAVELRPEDGFIVDSLGWAHFRLGEYDDSVIHLERAVELQPDDPVINDHLGDAYWRVGREREARYQWERALIFEPEDDVETTIREKLQAGLPVSDRERG